MQFGYELAKNAGAHSSVEITSSTNPDTLNLECREVFEVKAKEYYRILRREDGHYLDSPTEAAWKGWQCAWQYFTEVKQREISEDDIRSTFERMEKWIERLENWFSNNAQLVNGFKADAEAEGSWSEWDESGVQERMELQQALAALAPYLREPKRESVEVKSNSQDVQIAKRIFTGESTVKIAKDLGRSPVFVRTHVLKFIERIALELYKEIQNDRKGHYGASLPARLIDFRPHFKNLLSKIEGEKS